MGSLIGLFIWLVIVGLIFWMVWAYLIPLLPPPIQGVLRVVFIVICILFLLYMAAGVLPFPGSPLRLPR